MSEWRWIRSEPDQIFKTKMGYHLIFGGWLKGHFESKVAARKALKNLVTERKQLLEVRRVAKKVWGKANRTRLRIKEKVRYHKDPSSRLAADKRYKSTLKGKEAVRRVQKKAQATGYNRARQQLSVGNPEPMNAWVRNYGKRKLEYRDLRAVRSAVPSG